MVYPPAAKKTTGYGALPITIREALDQAVRRGDDVATVRKSLNSALVRDPLIRSRMRILGILNEEDRKLARRGILPKLLPLHENIPPEIVKQIVDFGNQGAGPSDIFHRVWVDRKRVSLRRIIGVLERNSTTLTHGTKRKAESPLVVLRRHAPIDDLPTEALVCGIALKHDLGYRETRMHLSNRHNTTLSQNQVRTILRRHRVDTAERRQERLAEVVCHYYSGFHHPVRSKAE